MCGLFSGEFASAYELKSQGDGLDTLNMKSIQHTQRNGAKMYTHLDTQYNIFEHLNYDHIQGPTKYDDVPFYRGHDKQYSPTYHKRNNLQPPLSIW